MGRTKNELVSVVVPVYNAEKYLDRCISSVVNQTYQNLEVILVDDGSLDGSPEMCDAWAAKDERVKVIHKSNEGAGIARNTALGVATGDYICFFDSDDYAAHDLIEKLYLQIKKHGAEVAICEHKRVNVAKNMYQDSKINSTRNVYCGHEVVSEFLLEFLGEDTQSGRVYNIPIALWASLFSMELVKRANWRIVSEREFFSEDLYSLLNLYRHVECIAILNEPLYYYCENEGSLSKAYREGQYDRIKQFYHECVKLCEENDYGEAFRKKCKEPFLSFTIWGLKSEESSMRPLLEKIKSVKEIVSDELLQAVLQEKKQDKIGMKKRLLYWALRNQYVWLVYLLVLLQNRFHG